MYDYENSNIDFDKIKIAVNKLRGKYSDQLI